MSDAKKKVIIYSTPSCPYCVLAKNYFKDNNIEYEEIDVSQDQKAAEAMIKKSGQMGVPQIEIDGEIIVGFDKEKIDKALNI
ncbi:NrdH-redoxin [Candidatus Berkelbacteria bacterium RIFCSPHIGHO2_12_FULL_36_9]|uniref:NrdH-redoxin n=1 Tax=Candidatus Berkelbacteria bacterium RIFCSPHIGHO2_12_FULL_36_9 TaxID=1797469 RepID=A0A1F5EIB4_9BACT|nr:MAG: NrdH-redoxin [Candidatus Berkelbacteria bacterium RIFCSPHIGHO2_12_FULL_36_9]